MSGRAFLVLWVCLVGVFFWQRREVPPSNAVEDVWVRSVFLFIYRHFYGTHHHSIWANLSFPVSYN